MEYPHISALRNRGEVLSEDAVSEAEKALSVISGGTPRADVARPGYRVLNVG